MAFFKKHEGAGSIAGIGNAVTGVPSTGWDNHTNMTASAVQAMMAAQFGTPNTHPPSLREMIYSRMRWGQHDQKIAFLHAQEIADNKVAIFVITDGKPVTLEDDANLFPSDTLVTQLRLLMSGSK